MTATSRSAAPHLRPASPERRRLFHRLLSRTRLAALAGDKSGASAIIIGLLSMVLLGFSALGTEVGYWYFVHRDLQNAVDSAALSAAAALEGVGGTPDSTHMTQATAEADYAATQYGFKPGTNGVNVTVNIPPLSGNYTTTPNAVEVILSEPQRRFLTAALSVNGTPVLAANPTQKVRAVATPAKNGNGCVVTLDTGMIGLTQNGNGNTDLAGCDLYVNSDNTNGAVTQNGNATITADNAYIVGAPSSTGNSALLTNNTYTGTAPINDPYANLAAPSFTAPSVSGGCFNASTPIISNATINTDPTTGVTTVSPTSGEGGTVVFCNENWPPNNSNILLDGGLYVFDGGSLGCQNCTISTMTDQGVTIYLTGGTGSTSNYAYLNFSGNQAAALKINAPTVAWMAAHPGTQALLGIAIFGDRNDPCNTSQHTCSVTSTFTGSGSATINGVIYLPNQNITWNGNGGSTPTCNQLIAFSATFNGNGTFTTTFSDNPSDQNCNPYHDAITGAGLAGAGAIPAHLVE